MEFRSRGDHLPAFLFGIVTDAGITWGHSWAGFGPIIWGGVMVAFGYEKAKKTLEG
jgi:hypothetical protein